MLQASCCTTGHVAPLAMHVTPKTRVHPLRPRTRLLPLPPPNIFTLRRHPTASQAVTLQAQQVGKSATAFAWNQIPTINYEPSEYPRYKLTWTNLCTAQWPRRHARASSSWLSRRKWSVSAALGGSRVALTLRTGLCTSAIATLARQDGRMVTGFDPRSLDLSD